jgi:dihydroneopterin aldolase
MSNVNQLLLGIKGAMSVGFSGLRIHCSVGILPHEQSKLQEIVISLKIRLPELPAFEEISTTIDYSVLAEICERLALSCHHGLLETLAAKMLDVICDRFSCGYGWIRIEKPAAIERDACAFVEYEKGI